MSVLNYDQSFCLNGQFLSGITDIDFSSDFGVGFISTLGSKAFGFAKVNPSVGKVDFSRSLIYADPIINYSGESAFSGQFSSKGVSYGFESGYLGSYSVSCGIGQMPAVSCGISVYGEMKTGAANQSFTAHPEVFVPSPKSISLINDYSSNYIQSFNYSFEVIRKPQYALGHGLFPVEVSTIYPIQVSSSITFHVKNFSPLDLQNFIRNNSSPSFSIRVKNRDLSQTLMTLPMENATIISQDIQGTVDSPLSITLGYKGYLE